MVLRGGALVAWSLLIFSFFSWTLRQTYEEKLYVRFGKQRTNLHSSAIQHTPTDEDVRSSAILAPSSATFHPTVTLNTTTNTHVTLTKIAKDPMKASIKKRRDQDVLKTNTLLDRFIVVPEYKLLFCYSEKTGCAMFNHLFRMLRLLHPNLLRKENEIAYQAQQLWFRNTPEHHGLNKSDLEHLLLDPRWTKAVFYRDPKSRFLSAFRSKCEHRDHDGKARCKNAFKQTNVSFVEAMEALKSPQRKEEVFSEPHFMPMSRFCGGLADSLENYDFIHELDSDTTGETVQTLFDHIGVPANVSEALIKSIVLTGGTNFDNDQKLVRQFHKTDIPFRKEKRLKPSHHTGSSDSSVIYQYFNEENENLVKEVYAIDYETFYQGYPTNEKTKRDVSEFPSQSDRLTVDVDIVERERMQSSNARIAHSQGHQGWDPLLERMGVLEDPNLFRKYFHPLITSFLKTYSLVDKASTSKEYSTKGVESKYLELLKSIVSQEKPTDYKETCPVIVLFYYHEGSINMQSLTQYYEKFGTNCIHFAVGKEFHNSKTVTRYEGLGYNFIKSDETTQNPIILDGLKALAKMYGNDTLVSVNDLDHLLVWKDKGRYYQYSSYNDFVLVYLHGFLSTEGCQNKNVNEHMVTPCTCMLEDNEHYISNDNIVWTEFKYQNAFHPTGTFYASEIVHGGPGTVYANLHPPLNNTAHHSRGTHLEKVMPSHPAVIHLRWDTTTGGLSSVLDKYATFLFGPKRNKFTDHNESVATAIDCVSKDPKYIEKHKSQCTKTKEVSNILSVLRQKQLCLAAGYSEDHCNNDLSCCMTVGSKQTTISNRTVARSIDTKQDSSGDTTSTEKCLVHIHGLHHSGTGFLRQSLFDALGGDESATLHRDTGRPEDEGQHIQSVYPNLKQRLRSNICKTRKNVPAVWNAYCCSALLPIANKESDKKKLFEEWSQYWDMSKTFLIQKTPSMDVVFLEKMKVGPTAHVISIRHPLSWHSISQTAGKDHDALTLLVTWTNVWAEVLGQLLDGIVKTFVVVSYEALVRDEDSHVINNVARLVKDSCSFGVSQAQQRRRLGLRFVADPSVYHSLSSKDEDKWDSCERASLCKSLMTDLKEVIGEFGYSWDRKTFYDPNANDSNNGILCSSENPPKETVVQRLKQLSDEYTARFLEET